MSVRPVMFFLLMSAFAFTSCLEPVSFKADFNDIYERTWIGKEFWTVPLEDWRVKSGRLECVGTRSNMRANMLTTHFTGTAKNFTVSMNIGLLESGEKGGSCGFTIGLCDPEDSSVRAACYFGSGIDAGIDTHDSLFLGDMKTALPYFEWNNILLSVQGRMKKAGFTLSLHATDGNESAMINMVIPETQSIRGIMAIFNRYRGNAARKEGARFWFDNIRAYGQGIAIREEHSFGPVLWSMYTLSRQVLTLSAQMPPMGKEDNHSLTLQVKDQGSWHTLDEKVMDPEARTVVFRIDNWDDSLDVPYRLVYMEKRKKGNSEKHHYEGMIRKDPKAPALVVGALTCQNHYGFPYTPVVQHLTHINPDMLYFSGDQIYEGNGGYGIFRSPADKAILNYLGKWYMFGWAFGDLMRDRPTVVTPDDHDVYQGNLWGDSGKKIPEEDWTKYHGTSGGYVQPAAMINVVHKTQCGHLPAPFDPTPIDQGIRTYYTDLVYGNVSFAIISDRMFKSAPNEVAFWEKGRKDWIEQPVKDPAILDKPGLQMIGQRQKEFLQVWSQDWRGARMKCLLSQTVFANIATHHGGGKTFLYGDMDSGGWPKSERDWIVRRLRQCFAFHISGDQHVPSFVQYGLDDYGSAGWAFCTPAIATGYERRFLPDDLGLPVKDRPDHGLPNTGDYQDAFGNLNTVYAIGNPVENTRAATRYMIAQNRSSGFGLVTFNTLSREIRSEAYHFVYHPDGPSSYDQFPGWPVTIGQLDNYGQTPAGYLPEIIINGLEDPVLQLIDVSDSSTVYMLRLRGNTFKPMIFNDRPHRIRIGNPELNTWKDISTAALSASEQITVDF